MTSILTIGSNGNLQIWLSGISFDITGSRMVEFGIIVGPDLNEREQLFISVAVSRRRKENKGSDYDRMVREGCARLGAQFLQLGKKLREMAPAKEEGSE